jgi:hypothetical protein
MRKREETVLQRFHAPRTRSPARARTSLWAVRRPLSPAGWDPPPARGPSPPSRPSRAPRRLLPTGDAPASPPHKASPRPLYLPRAGCLAHTASKFALSIADVSVGSRVGCPASFESPPPSPHTGIRPGHGPENPTHQPPPPARPTPPPVFSDPPFPQKVAGGGGGGSEAGGKGGGAGKSAAS